MFLMTAVPELGEAAVEDFASIRWDTAVTRCGRSRRVDHDTEPGRRKAPED